MRLFGPLYEWGLRMAKHRHAQFWLGTVSFTEAVIFPVPPDTLLAPMVLAQPSRWLRFALLCTLCSVAGGMIGYLIGVWAFEWVEPLLHRFGYWSAFERGRDLFIEFGLLVMFIAGFTPVPFKVFTIAAGVAGLGAVPFLFGSLIGRGGRFFLVAGLIGFGGKPMEDWLRRWIEPVGWLMALLVVLMIVYLTWMR